jgi:hypothetical protein
MAAWYATAATGLLFPLLDRLAPITKIAKGDFPCATHDCGCATAEQCRTQCCCFPNEPSPEGCPSCHEEKAVAVTYLSALKCSGSTDHGTAPIKLGDHLAGLAYSLIILRAQPGHVRFDVPSATPHPAVSDKVPI